jgi:putative ABC transport system permease protein
MTLVVGQGLALAVAGIAVGAAAGVARGRHVESQLYAVRPRDAVSFVVPAAVMIGTALAASLVPAVRALRVDPVTALRKD